MVGHQVSTSTSRNGICRSSITVRVMFSAVYGGVVLDVVAAAAVLDGVLQEFLAGAHRVVKVGRHGHASRGSFQRERTISIHSSWETSLSLILANSRSLSIALRS